MHEHAGRVAAVEARAGLRFDVVVGPQTRSIRCDRNLQALRPGAHRLHGVDVVVAALSDRLNRRRVAVVEPSETLLLKRVQVARRRLPHDVVVVAVLDGGAAGGLARSRVRMVLAQVVAELVPHDLQRVVAVDPRARRIAADRAETPPAARRRRRKPIDPPGEIGEVGAGLLSGLISEARPGIVVARRAVRRNREPAGTPRRSAMSVDKSSRDSSCSSSETSW